jgi:hypothetical protein
MKRASIRMAAGIAALALLAGCDLGGQANKSAPVNEAVADPGPAPAPPFDPLRLKFQPVFETLRVDAQSDVEAFVVMEPIEILLPDPGNAGRGRIYVVHARAGPVVVRAAASSIEGSPRLTLQRGQSAMVMSDGADSYFRLNRSDQGRGSGTASACSARKSRIFESSSSERIVTKA